MAVGATTLPSDPQKANLQDRPPPPPSACVQSLPAPHTPPPTGKHRALGGIGGRRLPRSHRSTAGVGILAALRAKIPVQMEAFSWMRPLDSPNCWVAMEATHGITSASLQCPSSWAGVVSGVVQGGFPRSMAAAGGGGRRSIRPEASWSKAPRVAAGPPSSPVGSPARSPLFTSMARFGREPCSSARSASPHPCSMRSASAPPSSWSSMSSAPICSSLARSAQICSAATTSLAHRTFPSFGFEPPLRCRSIPTPNNFSSGQSSSSIEHLRFGNDFNPIFP